MKRPEEIAKEISDPIIKTCKANCAGEDDWTGKHSGSFHSLFNLIRKNLRKAIADAIRSERTHPAPEVRKALDGVIEAFQNEDTERYYNTPDWNEDAHVELTITVADVRRIFRAKKALSAPSLEAVKCERCQGLGYIGYFTGCPYPDSMGYKPCPQRCDNGKVWVRKS